jgi:hypothetical protein
MFAVARVGIATGLVVVGDLIGEGSAQEQSVTAAVAMPIVSREYPLANLLIRGDTYCAGSLVRPVSDRRSLPRLKKIGEPPA